MEKLSRREFQSNLDRSLELLQQLGLSAEAVEGYRKFLRSCDGSKEPSYIPPNGDAIPDLERVAVQPKSNQLYNALRLLLKDGTSPEIVEAYLKRLNSGYAWGGDDYSVRRLASVLSKVAKDPEFAKALLEYFGNLNDDKSHPGSIGCLDGLFSQDLSPNVLASMRSLLFEVGLVKKVVGRQEPKDCGAQALPVNKVFGLTAYRVDKLLAGGKPEAAVLEFIANARTVADLPLAVRGKHLEGFAEIAKLDDAQKRSALTASFRAELVDVKPENQPDGKSFAQALIQLEEHRGFFGVAYTDLLTASKGLEYPHELINGTLLLKKPSGECDIEAVSALAKKASSLNGNLTYIAEHCQALRAAGASKEVFDIYLSCLEPKQKSSYVSSWAASVGRLGRDEDGKSTFEGLNNPAWLAETFCKVLQWDDHVSVLQKLSERLAAIGSKSDFNVPHPLL